MYAIGDLSRRTGDEGADHPLLRHRWALISAPDRTEGNQRRYEKADLDRLTFIRHARDLGFPNRGAIRELLTLSRTRRNPATERITSHASSWTR